MRISYLVLAAALGAATSAKADTVTINCRFDMYAIPIGIDAPAATGTDPHSVKIEFDPTTQKAMVTRKTSSPVEFDAFSGLDRLPDGTIKESKVNWAVFAVINGSTAASTTIAVSKHTNAALMTVFTAAAPDAPQIAAAYRGTCTKSQPL